MDQSIEEIKRQAILGSALTQVDWEILLKDASDAASLTGVLIASHKLNRVPSKETFENLLLTSVCRGEMSIALEVCKQLQRNLTTVEKRLLLESMVLTGNIESIHTHVEIDSVFMLSMFHTTAAIATCMAMRQSRGISIPGVLSLKSWIQTYSFEISHLSLSAKIEINQKKPFPGLFFIFSKETLHKLAGALISHNRISDECADSLVRLEIRE